MSSAMSVPVEGLVSGKAVEHGSNRDLTDVVCPACGAPECNSARRLMFQSSRGESPWTQCSECRAYHMIGEYDSDQEAEHTTTMPWGQHEDGVELNEFKKQMFQSVLQEIKLHAPDAKTILDVGCSFGGFLLEAGKHGYVGSGVDIVEDAVSYVRDKGFRAQACSSLTQCSLFSQHDPVDVLTVLDAHIYWPDQPKELRAAWNLIRPGGLLVLRAITKSQFISAGRLLSPVAPRFSQGLIRRAVTDHRFCMPLSSLLKTVQSAGFEIVTASPRGAQHSRQSSFAVRSLFAVGDFTWRYLKTAIAPGAVIVARKPAE